MLRPRDLSPIPSETAAFGRAVLPATDPYRVIGDHLTEILQDSQFSSLYEITGRAALSPSLLALVTIFQFLENIPDRDAARMVVVRLDWKFALHLPLYDAGFHFTDLHYFRQRLLAHQKERLVFETILDAIKGFGLLRKHSKQRTDSLAVLGAVRDLSRLELVAETMRTTIRALETADPAWAERALPASFRERYARRQSDYQLSEAERTAALQEVGQDGFWLLKRIDATGSAAALEEGVDSKERIVTPHDPGVRVGQKRGRGWTGEKVHVTETAEDGEERFLTDVTTANASSADVEALPEIRQHLQAEDLRPDEEYTDAGYVSGKQLADSRAAGIELLGPALLDTSPNGFKIADFQINRTDKEAICPAGQPAVKWSERTTRDGSSAVNIQFAAETCATCPLRDQCTTSQSGRSPSAEGLRQHRYRGDAPRTLENLLKGAACNLKRLARALAGRQAQAAAAATLRQFATAFHQPLLRYNAC